jgi:hypothetical protein
MVLPLIIVSKKSSVSFSGQAVDLDLNLAILPVRFVYLNSEQTIVKIFNNAKLFDSTYVLKFFDEANREINITDQKILEQYFAILETCDPFSEGFIFSLENELDRQQSSPNSLKVDFRQNELGLEEIYTYI